MSKATQKELIKIFCGLGGLAVARAYKLDATASILVGYAIGNILTDSLTQTT